jgi:nucleoside-diphosphate-sugar epimerase
VLVTGGAGYCGSRLVPQLLESGYDVAVYDLMTYGNDFFDNSHPSLTLIEGDIRDTDTLRQAMKGRDCVLHLACISNDASFELDEALSTSVNLDAFEPMVVAAKEAGVKRFVYASSSSVYGVSDEPDVTEDHPLVPLTLYNKYKGMCEPLLKKHTDESFVGVTFRPATVCGYAPRQRLDLSVNILTNHAVTNRKILVFGGSQLRPNLHVQDYCDLCQLLLEADDAKIADEIFNCGYQNALARSRKSSNGSWKTFSLSRGKSRSKCVRRMTFVRITSIRTRSATPSGSRQSIRLSTRFANSARLFAMANFRTPWTMTSTTTSAASRI